MDEEGKRGTKTFQLKEKKKKKTTRRVWSGDVSGEGMAGQGWGQVRVVGMVQSSTPPHLLIFSNHSLHQALFFFLFCFFFILGHAGPPKAANRSLNRCEQLPAERGRLPRLSRGYSSPTEGTGRESRHSTQFTNIWREKKKLHWHQYVMFYARFMCK